MQDLPFVEPGTILFRFLDPGTNHFWPTMADLLGPQLLFLNSRTRFNDPFDSKPDIINDVSNSDIRAYTRDIFENPWRPERDTFDVARIWSLKAQRKTNLRGNQFKIIKEGIVAHTNEFLDECGLTSFSLVGDDPVLWGHYAAGSSGVCVVFKCGASPVSAFNVCARVSYVEHRPQLPTSLFIRMTKTQRAGLPFGKTANEIFYLSFLQKSKRWQYEHEARIFFPFAASTKVRFDKSELGAIILGPKASPECERQIRKLVADLSPSTEVFRASLSKNGFDVLLPKQFQTFISAAA
jgi:hypothetical protein